MRSHPGLLTSPSCQVWTETVLKPCTRMQIALVGCCVPKCTAWGAHDLNIVACANAQGAQILRGLRNKSHRLEPGSSCNTAPESASSSTGLDGIFNATATVESTTATCQCDMFHPDRIAALPMLPSVSWGGKPQVTQGCCLATSARTVHRCWARSTEYWVHG